MLDETVAMPEDPEELRAFTARLLAEVKAQAVLIEKLRHQLGTSKNPCVTTALMIHCVRIGDGADHDARTGAV